MNSQPPLVLSLEPVLRCPNPSCLKMAYKVMGDLLTQTCVHCGAHWWATRLEAGEIRVQILAQFDGDDLFVHLLDRLGAPQRITQPLFWQLWLSRDEQVGFLDRSRPGGMSARSRALVKKLVRLHRRRE